LVLLLYTKEVKMRKDLKNKPVKVKPLLQWVMQEHHMRTTQRLLSTAKEYAERAYPKTDGWNSEHRAIASLAFLAGHREAKET